MAKGNIVVTLNSEYDIISRQKLQKLLTKLHEVLYRTLKIKINVGVGRIYGDILDISTSCNEAVSSVDYNMIRGPESFVFFEDIINKEHKIYWYPVEEQTRLIQSLKQGNIDMFNDELIKVCNIIKRKNISAGMIKSICFGIVNCIISIVNELDTDKFTSELEDMLEFKSIDDLQSKLGKIAFSICSYINEKKDCGNEKLKIAMLEFIHENYVENSLSLDMLAEEFNLTAKYLSKIFKEQVGCKFADYVKQLRIKHAKKLLTDTNMSIKEIVTAIGYSDTANFIRTFRISEGVTPGNFRKIKN